MIGQLGVTIQMDRNAYSSTSQIKEFHSSLFSAPYVQSLLDSSLTSPSPPTGFALKELVHSCVCVAQLEVLNII